MGSGVTVLSWESFCLSLLRGLQQSKSVILFQNSVQFEVSKKTSKIKPLSLLKTDKLPLSSVFQMCLGCMELHKVS